MQVLGNHFRVVRFLLFSFVSALVFCLPMFGRTSDIRLSILVGHMGTWALSRWALGTWALGTWAAAWPRKGFVLHSRISCSGTSDVASPYEQVRTQIATDQPITKRPQRHFKYFWPKIVILAGVMRRRGGLGESMKAFYFHAILSRAVRAPNQHLPGINWRLPWSGFIMINPQSRSIFVCGW